MILVRRLFIIGMPGCKKASCAEELATSCAKKSAKSLKEALGLTSALKKTSSVSHVTVSI
jgi:hypothetical protein